MLFCSIRYSRKSGYGHVSVNVDDERVNLFSGGEDGTYTHTLNLYSVLQTHVHTHTHTHGLYIHSRTHGLYSVLQTHVCTHTHTHTHAHTHTHGLYIHSRTHAHSCTHNPSDDTADEPLYTDKDDDDAPLDLSEK